MDIEQIEQIERWKEAIQEYKNKYSAMFDGKAPGEKCMASFCKLNGIPWPLPRIEIEYFVPESVEILFGGEMEG
jgi:hypothetical protein